MSEFEQRISNESHTRHTLKSFDIGNTSLMKSWKTYITIQRVPILTVISCKPQSAPTITAKSSIVLDIRKSQSAKELLYKLLRVKKGANTVLVEPAISQPMEAVGV